MHEVDVCNHRQSHDVFREHSVFQHSGNGIECMARSRDSKKIRGQAALSLGDDDDALVFFAKIIGRVLRGRWMYIDNAEK